MHTVTSQDDCVQRKVFQGFLTFHNLTTTEATPKHVMLLNLFKEPEHPLFFYKEAIKRSNPTWNLTMRIALVLHSTLLSVGGL